MQAVVLAAGKGTRLSPLTENVHKCMIPFYDKPFLEYLLESMVATGRVDEIILVVGYREDEIRNHFGDEFQSVPVKYRVQDPLQGTADALLQAKGLLKDRFFVALGDVYTSPEGFENMLDNPGEVTLAVTEVDDPDNHASVGIEGGRVQELREGNHATVDRGLWLFGETIFDFLPRVEECRGEFRILEAVQDMVNQGRIVYPKRIEEKWLQIGDHEGWDSLIKVKNHFEKLNEEISVKSKHDGSVIENSSVNLDASGCTIENSLAFGPGSLEECVLKESVLYTEKTIQGKELKEDFLVKTA